MPRQQYSILQEQEYGLIPISRQVNFEVAATFGTRHHSRRVPSPSPAAHSPDRNPNPRTRTRTLEPGPEPQDPDPEPLNPDPTPGPRNPGTPAVGGEAHGYRGNSGPRGKKGAKCGTKSSVRSLISAERGTGITAGAGKPVRMGRAGDAGTSGTPARLALRTPGRLGRWMPGRLGRWMPGRLGRWAPARRTPGTAGVGDRVPGAGALGRPGGRGQSATAGGREAGPAGTLQCGVDRISSGAFSSC